jgi:ParB-like chromosome segregation protein Spo0J
MDKLKIEYVDINSIRPYKNNAKLHPEEQIEQIKKSIEQFGMDDPIGIWKDEIVEGHGRLLACKELGYKEVPIIRLDHLTDEERKAYTLVHNKLTMNSDFDFNILDSELAEIDIDMSEFGFKELDINMDDYGTDFELPDGDKGNIEQITFTLASEQATLIRSALDLVKDEITETFGNENKNGNAIYEVVRQWVEQKK